MSAPSASTLKGLGLRGLGDLGERARTVKT